MKTGIYVLSFLIAGCSACTKQTTIKNSNSNAATVYLIKKGNHYADGNGLKLLGAQEFKGEVTFDSSAMYESINPENQMDVNKLIGFSDCGDSHQQNSARIGWSWNGKGVVLYAYAYVNGERMIKTLSTVPLNASTTIGVKATADKYYFTTGKNIDSLPRHCVGYTGTSYKLYPYFGGDEAAPHDVRISIREY